MIYVFTSHVTIYVPSDLDIWLVLFSHYAFL